MKSRSYEAYKNALITLLNKKDYDQIKATDIIKKSEYGRSRFYDHFKNKEDLVNKIVTEEAENYINILTKNIDKLPYNDLKLLEVLIVELLEYIYKNKKFYTLIINNKIPNYKSENFCKIAIEYFSKNFKGEIEVKFENIDLDFYYNISTTNFFQYVIYWDTKDYEIEIIDLKNKILEYINLF